MQISLAHYRLPIATAPLIGRLRVVVDRNRQIYLDGNRVISCVPSGEFLVLTLQNQSVYYVRAHEYDSLPEAYRRRHGKK
ncbi:MAG TPA: hypothetical protein PKA05_10630 [Roseiflexaceae bacterium]|nr:hypothetical protein [Roseiflexaceae bacterium]HMP40825.1 hypothetical protein [Roseiflexaceae bacterium]